MAERPGSFLSRWSRRKREPDREEAAARAGKAAGGAAAAEIDELATGDPAMGDPAMGDPAMGDPEVVAKLPDIDSLDETSDFTPFMAEGVPEILRRRALRKLWRLNPVFAHLDGLNDYDQDFTDAATVLPNLKSIYKVGKGMLGEPEADPQAADAGDGAAVGAPQPGRPPESEPPKTLSESPIESPIESVPPESSSREPAAPVAPAAPGQRAAAGAGDWAPSGPRRRRAESRRWGKSSQ
jgi:hypothetical protein